MTSATKVRAFVPDGKANSITAFFPSVQRPSGSAPEKPLASILTASVLPAPIHWFAVIFAGDKSRPYALSSLLPEGASVVVDVEAPEVDPIAEFASELLKLSKPRDWPADMALNHDHYLHGLPKK